MLLYNSVLKQFHVWLTGNLLLRCKICLLITHRLAISRFVNPQLNASINVSSNPYDMALVEIHECEINIFKTKSSQNWKEFRSRAAKGSLYAETYSLWRKTHLSAGSRLLPCITPPFVLTTPLWLVTWNLSYALLSFELLKVLYTNLKHYYLIRYGMLQNKQYWKS